MRAVSLLWNSLNQERPESHHQVQDTIPQHRGESTTCWRSEWFYCRFETPCTRPNHLATQPLTPPATPLSPTPVLQISEEDVRQVFRRNKRRKAPCPDGVTPACLKTCADQLAPIFTQIFNRSLELCKVPSCFKRSTITPVPKKPKIAGLMTTDLWL